jgi:hypothetical protein
MPPHKVGPASSLSPLNSIGNPPPAANSGRKSGCPSTT